ncbi:MAG: DUF6883 domain-containing protein [Candidatus Methylumidiphilus sp.]
MSIRLPNAENAVIDIAKLHEYCLNPLHPEGRHKARVFSSALGISQNDADWLRSALLEKIVDSDIFSTDHTNFGVRYTVDMNLQHGDFRALVRTGWIIRMDENVPRLTTCFVL